MLKMPNNVIAAGETLTAAAGLTMAAMAEAAASLAGLTPDYQPGPATDLAAPAAAARTALGLLLNRGGKIITVHPWTAGAGETGSGFYSQQSRGYLSPVKALEQIAKKLSDPCDAGKDTAGEVVILLMVSAALDAWIINLAALNAVFPFSELQMCERRARALAAMDSAKMEKRHAPGNPSWSDHDHRQPQAVRKIFSTSESLAAAAGAFAADPDPVTELAVFLGERQAATAADSAKWQELTASMTGIGPLAFFMTGATPFSMVADMQSTIGGNGIVNAEVYCAAVALAGPVGSLQFFREAFVYDPIG